MLMLFVSIWYTIDQAQDGIPLCSWHTVASVRYDTLACQGVGAGGGSSVKKATFNQFCSLHFVLTFLRAALAVGSCRTHDYLHQKGSPNSLGLSLNADKIPMHPYCLFKDLVTIFIFIPVLALFVYHMPNVLGQSNNYIFFLTQCKHLDRLVAVVILLQK